MHNYAIQYLAHKKYPPNVGARPFWNSAGPLTPIKPKLVEYLQAIDYRLSILKDTLRDNFNGIIVKSVLQGLFKEYDTTKTYQSQKKAAQDIMLAMDEDLCKQYGDMSRDVLENIDMTTEANLQTLAALAVMELQFMLGCGIGWRTSGGGGDGGAERSRSQ